MHDACTAPRASGLPLRDDKSPALQAHEPIDVPSMIAFRGLTKRRVNRTESFGFISESCHLLHELCVMRPKHAAAGGASSTPRCQGLWMQCAEAITQRDHCITVRDACLSFGSDGSLRIDGDTATRRSVYKSRDQGRRPPRLPDSWRLRLPSITNGAGRCASPSTRRLVNATLASPVFPTNFGESMLGGVFALHAQPPTEALLLAVSEQTWRDWSSKARFWTELLALFWPGSQLHLLTERKFFREEAGGGVKAPFLVDKLRTCHLHDAFDSGSRAFQGTQLSLLGEVARRHHRMPPRRPRTQGEGLRIGFVTPSSASDMRRIHNLDELMRACAKYGGVLSCDVVHLDKPGLKQNLHAVAPLHAMVALHGAHVTYASFPERPFALLEIKPFPMGEWFFIKYHQTAFALDTWTSSYFPGQKEHRAVIEQVPGERRTELVPQHQAAVLPVPDFLEWACNTSRRFREWGLSTRRRYPPVTGPETRTHTK